MNFIRRIAPLMTFASVIIVFVLVYDMIRLDRDNVQIGPNSPFIWKESMGLQGEGVIFLESQKNPVTIFSIDENKEKQYLTQTIAGDTPIGQNPTFYGQFTAIKEVIYRTSDVVNVYAKTKTDIVILSFPWIDILYLIMALCVLFYFAFIVKE